MRLINVERLMLPQEWSRVEPIKSKIRPVPKISLGWQGFTIVEVFVAILITMISLSVALQMFITAAYLRSQSGLSGDVNHWIQEDLEIVKARAEAFEQDIVPYSAYCGELPANNLAARFIADTTNGLGGASTTLGPRNFSGKSFTLTRIADYESSLDSTRLVVLNYALTPATGGNPEFEMNAEVAVYAAFKCPS